MITLGIFGDSFAAEWDQMVYGADQGWPVQIKNFYQTTNFASAGSSLEYSLDLLIKNHQHFDKVIFVTTGHPRIYHPTELIRRNSGNIDTCRFWHNIEQCKQFNQIYENQNGIFDTIHNAFEILLNQKNQNYLNIQYTSLIKYSQSIRSDIVLIPGCGLHGDIELWKNIGYSWDMSMIHTWETHQLKITTEDIWQRDNRPNHLSIENHQWMLNHILARLNNQFIDWEPTNGFWFKTRGDFEKYCIDKKNVNHLDW